jgi:SAM-dependent methyltransferase
MISTVSRLARVPKRLSELAALAVEGKVNRGYCPICESTALFVQRAEWLRDCYVCRKCNSIPRQRAIILVLNQFFPEWKNAKIHESSPGGASSDLIKKYCPQYIPSQFFPDVPPGQLKGGIRCENLEKMSFADRSLDLVISQDVLEHVMHPAAALSDISRVLKHGGAHVFTMPWYSHLAKTVQRARQNENGVIEYLKEPVYHGNPIDAKGSLVTFDWGADFVDFIYANSGMSTMVYLVKDRNMGLDGEFLEVFISRKSS